MMKRLMSIYLLIVILVIAGCTGPNNEMIESEGANGQDNEQQISETALDYEGDGGFLWKVVHGETIMYVHGTIHLGHQDFYPLASGIEEAYEDADVILPEINMFKVDLNEEEINEMALFEDDTTLDDVLSEVSYAKLSEIFEAHEMTLADYNHFQPWFLGTLLNQISNEESELAPEYGVDLYFLQRALEDNKEIVELETIEMQYEVLAGFNMETQVQMLEGSIADHEETASFLNQLGYNWVHGNDDAFKNQLTEGFEDIDEKYQQAINDTRNFHMANKLDEILQTDDGQTYFVIIGAAHVMIEPSVPGELEKKGYELERIY
ncbi:TraB/GumN family protein [Paenibacillus sp. 11B]|uniref:TraB/GumN family protein n=1 Tax=unclassified Paenibacillus TaxID=185978 RepID=UPI0026514148|nr:TraB/GumN family protein [Paenibacillus sp. 11B]MDN8592870.1 TraB/GumN family protein [Paenibacillus sp. 11B]